MVLTDVVNTFGAAMRARFGERAHKVAIDAGFTCPNRDGSKGRGGCTFCNNRSFNQSRRSQGIAAQVDAGRRVVGETTGARLLIAYFQAYTNTYAAVETLRTFYDEALAEGDVVGLAVGTRPDCCPDAVLDLLAQYRDRGVLVWLELGLQSSFDESLARVNRGHGFAEYRAAVRAARGRGLPVCTHLIIGLPGEDATHAYTTLSRVLEDGVDGLKLHPLHVIKGTRLARSYREGGYRPWALDEYVQTACDLIERTPETVIFHRLTGTAPPALLLAPAWCMGRWRVLNAIEAELRRRHTAQGAHV